VDVTLVDSANGEELLMPTDYDDFTEKAAHDYATYPKRRSATATLLREVMEGHGFAALETEWWHYDLPGLGAVRGHGPPARERPVSHLKHTTT
jgi:D-alanyl-D-alanine dipeptidase